MTVDPEAPITGPPGEEAIKRSRPNWPLFRAILLGQSPKQLEEKSARERGRDGGHVETPVDDGPLLDEKQTKAGQRSQR